MQSRQALRTAPEVASAGDAATHYGAAEAARYDDANGKVQAELACRCAAMLALPPAQPALLLDAGCGSCLGWDALQAQAPSGVFCLGMDVSRAMLQRASAAGAARHGDLVLCDLAQRLPLRAAAVYDGVLSVSALQWLCRTPPEERTTADEGDEAGGDARRPGGGNKRHAKRALERRRKLARSGVVVDGAFSADAEPPESAGDEASPLRACLAALTARLVPGARLAAQVYPAGRRQAAELEAAVAATTRLRLGGLLADLPHSAPVVKRFLCLQAAVRTGANDAGSQARLQAPPCPLSWPLQGGCALWWRAAAGAGAPGDAWEERLARWHAKEARWQARLAAQPRACAADGRKQAAQADEQARGAAKAAMYGGEACCAAWRDAVAAQQRADALQAAGGDAAA
jgi:hypothetical protein